MYIDFAGDKLEVVDSESGECRSVEVFVAILPCSHYTYCEAVWSQSRQDLIKACENALHFYGGVPMAIVPDNLKSDRTDGVEIHSGLVIQPSPEHRISIFRIIFRGTASTYAASYQKQY